MKDRTRLENSSTCNAREMWVARAMIVNEARVRRGKMYNVVVEHVQSMGKHVYHCT